ncbi:MAG: uncharacterized membrane protein (UPF0127 family) [Kiritimatiellia bacterium]
MTVNNAWSWGVIGLLVTVSIGCRNHNFPTRSITVGDNHMLVEVASDGGQRAQGLMYRDSLPASEGMLFIYPAERELSFWMKNTRIALSIAFARSDGTIIHIAHMRPMSQKSTKSEGRAIYALEVNKGWFEEHGVDVGDKLGNLPEAKGK